MNTVIKYLRYVVIIPTIGLILAAVAFFVIGGFQLIRTILEAFVVTLNLAPAAHAEAGGVPFAIEIVEYVHQFLIGTVLFITGLGFYQLFISSFDAPEWLLVTNTEQLESSLVGVTVVVMAVHFMTAVFTVGADELLSLGLSTAAVIAALALFQGLRAWADKLSHSKHNSPPHESP